MRTESLGDIAGVIKGAGNSKGSAWMHKLSASKKLLSKMLSFCTIGAPSKMCRLPAAFFHPAVPLEGVTVHKVGDIAADVHLFAIVIHVDPENSKSAQLGSLGTLYIKCEIQTSLTPVICKGMTAHQAKRLKNVLPFLL